MPLSEFLPVELRPLPELPDRETAAASVAGLAQAQPGFAALLARYDQSWKALRHFGLMAWERNDLVAAIEAFRTAVALEPDDARLWSDLAGVFGAVGQAEAAEACIRASLSRSPQQAPAWLTLAALRNGAGDAAEAERAFRAALAIDPTLPAAHFGLGLLHFGARRLDEAAEALRAAVAHGAQEAMTFVSLGHVLYLTGHFTDCVAAFDRAAALQTLDPRSHARHAHAIMIRDMIAGDLAGPIERYRSALDPSADVTDGLRRGFSMLSGYGHEGAAAALGEVLVREHPDDPVQRYLLDAVRRKPLSRAPDDYLETFFDQFAPIFDKTLVEVLRYDVPGDLTALMTRHCSRFETIVDLGCGTGLAAKHLRPLVRTLLGVDISGAMLERARDTGRYDALHKAEIVHFLQNAPSVSDGLFAADLVIYLGDLEPFFSAAGAALRRGGWLAISIEVAHGAAFSILPSGRFAHAPDYVERTAGDLFELVETQARMIRLEANRPVDGLLMLFQRR